jgi:pimeloyl-ACP methyl ester carboxylesterase
MNARGNARTIVLIHGLWVTALCWEHWIERYTARGHKVIAPSWPGMDGDIDEFRRDPSAVGRLGVTEIVEHYDAIIRGLDEPPIIMGHSFGGLFTQILVDRGLGLAGVAIDPAPVKGILLLPFSSLRVAFPALSNPLHFHKVQGLTAEQFHYAFGNLLSEEESRAVYERYAVPGPDHVLFQASLANFNPHAATAVDFHNNDRAPATDRGRQGPHRSGVGHRDQLPPVPPLHGCHGLQGVPGTLSLHDRREGLGRSRGLCARLGHQPRRVARRELILRL